MSCYCLPLGMVGRFQLPSCNCSFHRKGLSCFAICCFACSMPSPKEVQHVQRPATIPEQSSTVDADDQVPLEPSQITCRFLDFVACLHVFTLNFQCESYESKMRTVQASLGQQPAPFSECSLEWLACLHVMTCVCYMSHVSPQVSKFYK